MTCQYCDCKEKAVKKVEEYYSNGDVFTLKVCDKHTPNKKNNTGHLWDSGRLRSVKKLRNRKAI